MLPEDEVDDISLYVSIGSGVRYVYPPSRFHDYEQIFDAIWLILDKENQAQRALGYCAETAMYAEGLLGGVGMLDSSL